MRGISKPCPPDDAYPDGPAPTSFGDAENAYLESLDRLSPARDPVSFARSEFDQLAKYKLRREMYREQGSLCVYCERKIAEGRPVPSIEHWCPLSCNPRLALHWKNLYLSCPSPDTCDSAKGNRRLRWDDADDDMPWPANFRYEDFLGFTSRGVIYVRSDVVLEESMRRALELAIKKCPDGNRVRPSIVNLNHSMLVKARAAAVAEERMLMEAGTTGAREERAAWLLDQDPLPAFVSIRVAYLRKQLGLGGVVCR